MKRQGFTLVEVIFASSLFALIAVMGAATLSGIFKAERQTRILSSNQEAVRYPLETIAREIRFAKSVKTFADHQSIEITNQEDAIRTYFVLNGQLTLTEKKNADDDGTPTQITTNGTEVVEFTVIGDDEIATQSGASPVVPTAATPGVATAKIISLYMNVKSVTDPKQSFEVSTLATPRRYQSHE